MNPIFLDNKYTRWYYAIIERCAVIDPTVYSEEHHIIPESFFINRTRDGDPGWLEGNPDEPSNLVRLNTHWHAFCHWLLTKMTAGLRGEYKMLKAFDMMSVDGEHMGRKMGAAIVRAYAKNRESASKAHGEKMREQFENGREIWNKGRKEDRPDVLANVRKAAQNRDPLSGERLAEKVAKSIKTMKKNGNDKRSDETKKKMSASQTGISKPKNDAFRLQVSKTLTGVPKREGHGDAVAAAVKGNISINRNGVEKKVKQPELQSYLDDGWSLGGRPRKKRTQTA